MITRIKNSQGLPLILAGLVTGSGLMLSQAVSALPSGATNTHGSASVTTGANTVMINQTSNRAVVEWNNYNIAAGETVIYNMASDAAILNLVKQGATSNIDGRIGARGQVFLVNPHGIIFGSSAQVSVGSLVASTLVVDSDEFFNGGPLSFSATDVKGVIINQGSLLAAAGGNIALLGNSVVNTGHIQQARAGNVTLASGEAMTLDFDGDGLMQIEVTKEVAENIGDYNDAILNSGNISAGNVLLEAHVAANVFTNAVNHTGEIVATAIEESVDGAVRLVGNGGSVVVDLSATIIAESFERSVTLPPPSEDNPPEETPEPPSLASLTSDLQQAVTNSGSSSTNSGTPATTNSSLGLFNIEAPGVRLPDDQLEEEL